MFKNRDQHSLITPVIILVILVGALFSSCRSTKIGYTIAPPIASLQVSEPSGTITPRFVDQTNTAKTTEKTPGPTETPVPPVIATPEAPLFPMAGIEIARFDDIEQVAQAGSYWVRRNALLWSVVEPVEGTRDWGAVASLERELEGISSHGMQTILIVRGTPSWAQKILGIQCAPMSAEKIGAFAAFMHDAVIRYSQPPFNVKYWELGNEPDVDPALVSSDSQFGCWGDPADAYYGGGYYAGMLKIVYPAIKAADPEAQVLVGGLLLLCDPVNPPENRGEPEVKMDCSPANFFEGVLRNGGGDYFDGVSFHAYDYYFDVFGKYGNGSWRSSWKTTGPVLIAKTLFLRSLLAQYGYSDKYLMNTELAILCGVSGNEPPCGQADWEYTKAYHLVEAYTAAATVGLRANIWYSLTGWRGSGLVDPSRQPAPAYQALTFNLQMLQGAIPWGEITLYQGVKGFAFQREGRLIWVLWSQDGHDHPIPLGSQPGAIYDAFGASLPIAINIVITQSPIYIEW